MSNSGAATQLTYGEDREPTGTSPQRGLFLLAPVVAFAVLSVVLAFGLTRNARDIPSALIGKPVPEFSLPPVKGRALGLSSADLKREVSLVNVFASWCVACRYEHPFFMELKTTATAASPSSTSARSIRRSWTARSFRSWRGCASDRAATEKPLS